MKINVHTILEQLDGLAPAQYLFATRLELDQWLKQLMLKKLNELPTSLTYQKIFELLGLNRVTEAWALYAEHFKSTHDHYTFSALTINAPLRVTGKGGWIKVPNGLPVTYQKVLLCTEDKTQELIAGWYHPEGYWLQDNGKTINARVTHWRPLPPLPKD